MKILILNYEYPPLGRGGGIQSLYLAKEYAKTNEVYFLTAGYKDFGIQKIDGYTLNKINTFRKRTYRSSIIEMLTYVVFAWFKLSKILRAFHPDVVHIFFGIPTGLLVFHPRINKLPYIISVLGSDIPGHNRDTFIYRMIYKIIASSVKKIWKNAKRVVPNSEMLQSEILEVSTDLTSQIIPSGIEIKRFDFPKHWNNKNELRLLFVGRLIPLKNVNLVIEALPNIIKHTNKKILFRVVGGGLEAIALKELTEKLNLNNYVCFLGEVDENTLVNEYKNADIYIQLSKTEGMSTSILEAMLSGLPVITTNVGGTKELINGNGFVVNELKQEEIINAVNQYLQDESLIKKHGEQSKLIAQQYDFEHTSKEYLALLSSII